MNYYKTYKSFIYGRYVSEGVRMTAGILLPAFVMNYFGMLATGIVMSVGALCVSAADSPGPVHHRANAMLTCNVLILVIATLTAWVIHLPVILGIILFVFTFIFAMLSVYGARAGSVGIAAMLVMILNLQHPRQGWDIIINASYIFAGGVWYMLFSLTLQTIRPYKLIQQILGDCIQGTADYLRTRASFYDKDVQYDATYNHLMQQQADVQQKQSMVSELLFKTRTIVKESTHKGRILVMIYLDVADLFERVMTSYQEYSTLHKYFDDTHILEEFKVLLLHLSDELEEIGIAVKIGNASYEKTSLPEKIKNVDDHFNELRKSFMHPENVEGFIALGRILANIRDLAERVNILYHYTTYDRKLKKKKTKIEYEKFVDHTNFKPEIFFNNLNLNSNIFRHSLRVSLAVLAGYIISLTIHIGHSYWTLLTIVVILKPAYSLTKKRNKDRLIGTVCGIAIGIIVLYFIKNDVVLLTMMILFMTGAYIFLRTNYFVSVILMTPYLLLFFHLLYPNDFKALLTDRLIDTAIGSGIAFIASIFLIPAWERNTIKSFMIKMLEDNCTYYTVSANAFLPEQPVSASQLQVARKNALVSLANLSDAFTRMLSEPKRHQKGIEDVHRFVVLNHTLTSHIATLSYYLQAMQNLYRSNDLSLVIQDTVKYFNNAIESLQNISSSQELLPQKESLRALNEQAEILLKKRREELQQGLLETDTKRLLVQTKSVTDQFNYIYSIASDINKITRSIELE